MSVTTPTAGDAGRLDRLRRTVYRLLERGDADDRASQAVDGILLLLILANAAISVLETVPEVGSRYGRPLYWFEAASVGVFTVEYALRLWSCTAAGHSPMWGRVRFALRPMLLVDLAAILPFFLFFLGLDLRMVRVLRLTRIFRVAKFARYSHALRVLAAALSSRRDELVISLLAGLFALILSATLIYYAEHGAQPDVFRSIPASFWWAVTTLTTVGYGDTYPVTLLGRVLGGLVQVIGVGFVAMPTGVLAAAFLEQHQALRGPRRPSAAEPATGVATRAAAGPAPARCPHCGRPLQAS